MKFTEKEIKGMDIFAKRALERLQFIAIESLACFGEGTEEAGRIPARWLAGGEGEVAREVEQFKANLCVVVTRLEVAGRVVIGVGQSATARVLVDGGAPAVKGEKGMAGGWEPVAEETSGGGAELRWSWR